MRLARTSGFSLIELMISIAILAILLALGWPSFQGSLRSNRIATASNEFLAALSLARSEAIRNTRGSGICASTDGTSCDGTDWAAGWLVWGDTNGDGTFDAGEPVLRVKQDSAQVTVTGPADPITFDSRGRRRGSTDVAVTMQPDECGGRQLQRTLTVKAVGQVSMARGDCT